MKTIFGLMKKISGWRAAWLAVAVMVLPLLAANVVRADSVSDKAATLDILGVHIGMTPGEAKSVLAQHGMDWVETKGDLGISEGQFLYAAVAHGSGTGPKADTVSVFFATPPGDSKVIAVARNVGFDASGAPTLKNLVKELTEKFGQPSWTQGNWWAGWVWDKAGQISKTENQRCPSAAFDFRVVFAPPESTLDRSGAGRNWWSKIPPLQEEYDRNCALAVKVAILADQGGVVTNLREEIVDMHAVLQTAIASDNHVKQLEQAKREEAVKKAGANKPAL